MGLRGKTEAEQLFSQVYLYHFTPSKERLSHPQRSQHGTFNNCIIKMNKYVWDKLENLPFLLSKPSGDNFDFWLFQQGNF